MKVTVCIGSSCRLTGSSQVVVQLQELIRQHGLYYQLYTGAFELE